MVLACRETFPTILQRPANRIAKKVGGATPICARVLLRVMADDCFTHGASAQRRVFAQTRRSAGSCTTSRRLPRTSLAASEDKGFLR